MTGGGCVTGRGGEALRDVDGVDIVDEVNGIGIAAIVVEVTLGMAGGRVSGIWETRLAGLDEMMDCIGADIEGTVESLE